MKKSLKFLALLCLPAFSLTACSDLLDMFYFGGSINQGGGYQSISTPPPGGDVPEYAPTDFTYKKYHIFVLVWLQFSSVLFLSHV